MPQTDGSSLPLSPRRIWARYWIETAFPVEKAVEALAGEQPAELSSSYRAKRRNCASLIGTIVKPSVGLSPEETASLARTLAEAGIDFIKDELQADGPYCPFAHRVTAVMRVLRQC